MIISEKGLSVNIQEELKKQGFAKVSSVLDSEGDWFYSTVIDPFYEEEHSFYIKINNHSVKEFFIDNKKRVPNRVYKRTKDKVEEVKDYMKDIANNLEENQY